MEWYYLAFGILTIIGEFLFLLGIWVSNNDDGCGVGITGIILGIIGIVGMFFVYQPTNQQTVAFGTPLAIIAFLVLVGTLWFFNHF